MNKKVLVITTYQKRWEAFCNVKGDNIRTLEGYFRYQVKKEFEDIDVLCLFDSNPKEKIKRIIKAQKITPNYIALHGTPYRDDTSAELDYKHCLVEYFSHDGGFYQTVLNKIAEDTLTLNDVKQYFPLIEEIGSDFISEILNSNKLSSIEVPPLFESEFDAFKEWIDSADRLDASNKKHKEAFEVLKSQIINKV